MKTAKTYGKVKIELAAEKGDGLPKGKVGVYVDGRLVGAVKNAGRLVQNADALLKKEGYVRTSGYRPEGWGLGADGAWLG